jgi:hypothetical protein
LDKRRDGSLIHRERHRQTSLIEVVQSTTTGVKGVVEKVLSPTTPMPHGGPCAGCAQSEGDEASSKPAQGGT